MHKWIFSTKDTRKISSSKYTTFSAMATIQNFQQMTEHLTALPNRFRIAVVCGSDESTLYAVERTLREGFAQIIFVGDTEKIQLCGALQPYASLVSYVTADGYADAAAKAVALIHDGKADVLMKGLISTDILLRAVLNKENGLLPAGKVLTHLSVAQIPGRDQLLFFTDAAVIPYPTQEQRMAQVGYAIKLCHTFGIEEPRVSLLHCAEHVSEKFPHTMGYKEISERAAQGEWGRAIVDGPLDLRTSIDPAALAHKGIESPLEGQADVLVFPDIEAGNVFYKTISFLTASDVAGTLQGTLCPVVLPSRGDSGKDKFYSMAFAAMAVE